MAVILGKADTVTKEYLKEPAIFADAFNKYLFHGRQVIKPQMLHERDTSMTAVPYGAGDAGIPEQKYRDSMKMLTAMTDGRHDFCILGIEAQHDTHYAMPVKNGLYDFLQLSGQVTQARKSHRKKENREKEGYKPNEGEYLSGFWKNDRLIPTITLAIYFGADEWDAPLSLHEMYATQDDVFLRYAPDYHVNLIAPFHMTDGEMDEFQTSLREVMLYIKYSKDKKKLYEIVESDARFRNMERSAVEVLNAVTSSELKYPDGKEGVDMCSAIKEMREESENIGKSLGKIIGSIETSKEFGKSQEETAEYIMRKYKLSHEKASEYISQYWIGSQPEC